MISIWDYNEDSESFIIIDDGRNKNFGVFFEASENFSRLKNGGLGRSKQFSLGFNYLF